MPAQCHSAFFPVNSVFFLQQQPAPSPDCSLSLSVVCVCVCVCCLSLSLSLSLSLTRNIHVPGVLSLILPPSDKRSHRVTDMTRGPPVGVLMSLRHGHSH